MWCDTYNCSEAYASNVKCMYTNTSGRIIDCIEFIWDIYIYWYSCLIWAHELIATCGLYVAFEGHINFWHIHGSNTFLVTWSWWCHQWPIAFIMLRWLLRGIHITFCASTTSTGTGIRVMCQWWYHLYNAMQMAMATVRDLMVPLVMPLTSCDTNSSNYGIAWL